MLNNSLLFTHYLFSSKILLTLLGAIITYAYGDVSHYYWLFMLPIFALLALLPYYLNLYSNVQQQRREIIMHWLGGLICGFFVFSLYFDGRLFHEETALILLSILVFMLYLDCLKQPTLRSIYVVGVLIILDLLLAFTDMSIGLIVLLAIVGVVWSYIDQSKQISNPMSA